MREVLIKLRRFDFTETEEALDYLREHWYMDGATSDLSKEEAAVVMAEKHDRFLRLAIGGWSGNEALLAAYRKSKAHFVTWVLSARGGLSIHRYPRGRYHDE